MYGSVAKFRVKKGIDKAEFIKTMDSFDSANIKGWMADYIYQMDADSDEFYLVAVFRDKESYLANADDPSQHERYLTFRSFLEADPEWHDGAIVSATGPNAK